MKKYKYHIGLKCLHCNAMIFSSYRHDFVVCKCKESSKSGIFVDGGFDYFRYGYPVGWKKGADFKTIRRRIHLRETKQDIGAC